MNSPQQIEFFTSSTVFNRLLNYWFSQTLVYHFCEINLHMVNIKDWLKLKYGLVYCIILQHFQWNSLVCYCDWRAVLEKLTRGVCIDISGAVEWGNYRMCKIHLWRTWFWTNEISHTGTLQWKTSDLQMSCHSYRSCLIRTQCEGEKTRAVNQLKWIRNKTIFTKKIHYCGRWTQWKKLQMYLHK